MRNKVHRLNDCGDAAICGVDSGGNSKNIVPRSREDRDLAGKKGCLRCKAIIKKRPRTKITMARNGRKVKTYEL